MQKVNKAVTLALSVVASLLWAHGWWMWVRPGAIQYNQAMSDISFARSMATVFTCCACLGWILLSLSETFAWGEFRCRKCRYILKGLSEPRCPECGTPI